MFDEKLLVIGSNYWPREKAMHWWGEFELSPVKRDFSLMAEYGLELIRVFLLWEDFQPEVNRISVRALEDLVRVADLANDHRMKILPAFFCGHMCGVNWLPPWMLEAGKKEGMAPAFSAGGIRKARVRNMYSDREVWKAQKVLIHETTNALHDHPAVWGWDLGHKPSCLGNPPSRDSARAWLEEMSTELKRWNSSIPLTMGIGQEDLEEARIPGPRDLAPYIDFLLIHVDPGKAKWAEGLMDEKAPLFLGFMAQWLGGKEVLVGDLGVPTEPLLPSLTPSDRRRLGGTRLVQESQAEAFYQQSLDLLKRYGIRGALGRSVGDYDSSLWDKPPFDHQVAERFCGLFRKDGSAKPAARLLKDYPRKWTPGEISRDWVDIRPEEYYENSRAQLTRLYQRFKDRF